MSTREQVNNISSVTLENIYKNPAYKALISQFKNRGISLCNQELEDIAWLLLISHTLGINRSCVQASGGNTSLKIQEFILIKASGKKLKDCLEDNIFILIKKEDFNEEEESQGGRRRRRRRARQARRRTRRNVQRQEIAEGARCGCQAEESEDG